MVDSPLDIALLPPASQDKRVCVAISDIHCTDCTVGNQTGDAEDWRRLFAEIAATAADAGELLILLNGDIADLIRTDVWHCAGVYPWQRDHPQFPALVGRIMDGIVARHATPGGFYADASGEGTDGFFVQLHACLNRIRASHPGLVVRIIPIVGNHDKELMAVADARRRFYRDCLGWPDGEPDGIIADWIAAQYGRRDNPPLMPFYFGDTGWQLFATHGQWRDDTNSRNCAGWRGSMGWQPALWRQQGYLPFTAPCFGDTVASCLLSGFIHDAKAGLAALDANVAALDAVAVGRFQTILDELDLYRPAAAGMVRILQEARRQRSTGVAHEIIDVIVDTLHDSLRRWLAQPFAHDAAPPRFRYAFMPLLGLASRLRLESVLLWVLQWVAHRQAPEATVGLADLLALPAFQTAYRELGFRLHVEGHTHIALEAELQFDQPVFNPNYTYVNLGAWRSQLVVKDNTDNRFRRRGIGRALFIIDEPGGASRQQRYFALDLLRWGGHHDDMRGTKAKARTQPLAN